MIRAGLDLGIAYFDTAPSYGELAERVLGEELRGRRDKVAIATKTLTLADGRSDLSPEGMRAPASGASAGWGRIGSTSTRFTSTIGSGRSGRRSGYASRSCAKARSSITDWRIFPRSA